MAQSIIMMTIFWLHRFAAMTAKQVLQIPCYNCCTTNIAGSAQPGLTHVPMCPRVQTRPNCMVYCNRNASKGSYQAITMSC